VKPVGAFYDPQVPLPQHGEWPNPSTLNRSGFLFGGGVEMKLPLFRVTPGLRYARYGIVEKIGPQEFGPFVYRTPVESPNAFDFVLDFKPKRGPDRSSVGRFSENFGGRAPELSIV
jgi:hypothetical protein